MILGWIVDLPGFGTLQNELQIVDNKAVDKQADEGDEEQYDRVWHERFDLFPSATERDEQIERGTNEEKDEQVYADYHDDSDVPKMRGGRGFLGETVEHDAVREERDQAEHQAADEDQLFGGFHAVHAEYDYADQNADQVQHQLTGCQGDQLQFRVSIYVDHFGTSVGCLHPVIFTEEFEGGLEVYPERSMDFFLIVGMLPNQTGSQFIKKCSKYKEDQMSREVRKELD